PRLVLNSIARHLDDMKESGGKSLMTALQDSLRDKSLLLILDNFEHLLSAAPLVSELLGAAPNLTVLATSREILRLYGEHEFPVSPLPLPNQYQQSPAHELQAFEAIDLFAQRARAVAPDFILSNDNAVTVAAICVHLDGLPLAIELAAARIRFYAPQTLLIRLASRLETLGDGPRDLPARQRTLRATLAWSYDLLNEDEKLLFARLGVFANGCTYAAAQAVCGENLSIDISVGLESLLAKSLLRAETASTGDARVVMLETMREYALEQLAASGELTLIRERHLHFFRALLWTAAREYNGPNEAHWLAKLEAEHDNFRAALQWTLNVDGAAQDSLSMIAHLARLWEVKGYFTEARDWLLRALRQPGAEQPTKARADALHDISASAYLQCDYAASQALYVEALTIYQDLGDQSGVAKALISIGEVATEIGDYKRAPQLFESAYAMLRQLDDATENARALTQIGYGALRVGDLVQAQARLEEGLAAYRLEDDTVGVSLALAGLGEIAVRTDALKQATDLLEESLWLRQQIGYKWGTAVTLGSLAWVALRQNDLVRAAQILREILRIRFEIDDRGGIAWCVEKFAEIASWQGDAGQAVRLYGAAAAIRIR
ncbi:MAG: hypothetical protein EHM39_09205, partial [Chloroflexi bacterium]